MPLGKVDLTRHDTGMTRDCVFVCVCVRLCVCGCLCVSLDVRFRQHSLAASTVHARQGS